MKFRFNNKCLLIATLATLITSPLITTMFVFNDNSHKISKNNDILLSDNETIDNSIITTQAKTTLNSRNNNTSKYIEKQINLFTQKYNINLVKTIQFTADIKAKIGKTFFGISLDSLPAPSTLGAEGLNKMFTFNISFNGDDLNIEVPKIDLGYYEKNYLSEASMVLGNIYEGTDKGPLKFHPYLDLPKFSKNMINKQKFQFKHEWIKPIVTIENIDLRQDFVNCLAGFIPTAGGSYDLEINNSPFDKLNLLQKNGITISNPSNLQEIENKYQEYIGKNGNSEQFSSWLNIYQQNQDNKDINTEFFNQIISKLTSRQIQVILDGVFRQPTEQEFQELKNGKESNGAFVPFNYSDVVNGNVPTIFNYNDNFKTLLELNESGEILKQLYDLKRQINFSSPWMSVVENVINKIIALNFSTIDELLKVKSLINQSNNGTDLTGIDEAKELISKWQNKMYQTVNSSSFNNWLNPFRQNNLFLTNELFPVPGYETNSMSKYIILASLILGLLNSGEISCDVQTSYQTNDNEFGGQPFKEKILYSGIGGGFNDSFFNDIIADDVKEDNNKCITNVTLSNFKFTNKLKTVFLSPNIDKLNTNTFNDRFQTFQINYKAGGLELNNFGFEKWTDNKDAIGISINKYLSELINLEGTNVNGLLNPETKDSILQALHGKYALYDKNNKKYYNPRPAYLLSGNQQLTGENSKINLFNEVISGVSKIDIDNLLSLGINHQDWIDAWTNLGIELDKTANKYPMIRPDQYESEFYVIAKINKFFTNSDYEIIRSGMINGIFSNVKPISLINKQPLKDDNDGTGYFLVRLKACFDQNYDLNLKNNRRYTIINSDNLTDSTTSGTFKNFINRVLLNNQEGNIESNIDASKRYWFFLTKNHSSSSFFQDEKWENHHWKLNYSRIWFDLLKNENPQSGLVLLNQTERNKTIEHFKWQVLNMFIDMIKEKYGIDSREYKYISLEKMSYDAIKMIYSLLDPNNKSNFINGIPYLFMRDVWKYLDDYQMYLTLIIQGEQYAKDNVFYKYFQKMESANNHEKIATIKEIFGNMLTCRDFLNSANDDKKFNQETNDLLSQTYFRAFYYNWNTNSNGNTPGTTDYNDWLKSLSEYLESNDFNTKFKTELVDVFLNNFGIDLINNLSNWLVFDTSSVVNQNFIFSSLEELSNDPMFNIILKNFNTDIDDYLIKSEYLINETPLTNENGEIIHTYTLKSNEDETEKDLPIKIYQVPINGINYWTFKIIENANISFMSNIDTLKEIVNVSYTDPKTEQSIPVVLDNQGRSLKSQLVNDFNQLDNLKAQVISINNKNYNYDKKLNVVHIVLVTIIPIVSILIVLFFVFMHFAKKKRYDFAPKEMKKKKKD